MISAFAAAVEQAFWSVAVAIAPMALLFLVFQIFLLRLPPDKVREILIGTAIAAAGLFLFLVGIGFGFLPLGRAIGQALGDMDRTWLFVAVGAALGLVTAWGEPSVRILADQVEEASSGSIRSTVVVAAVCVGVAVWAGLGVLRIAEGISLLYLLVPGYLLAIALIALSDRSFVAIAADAGGVTTGPLANTFLLAFALGGAASNGGGDILMNGFGFVALIALAPITSVMLLGLFVRPRESGKEKG